MGRTWKDGSRQNRDKRMHRVRRDGYFCPDSDMALIDDRDEREMYNTLDQSGNPLRGLDLISTMD